MARLLDPSAAIGSILGIVGDLIVLEVESEALRGNALGDPHVRRIPVYLPPQYETRGERRFPVVYYLPSYASDAWSSIGRRPWEESIVARCDRLIATGAMPPAILVVVDGWTRLGGSQYVDSRCNGGYATYVTREVVGAVDAVFATRAEAAGRAVVGKSSGGFGALHLALRYPGVFGAVASHSGDSAFAYSAMPAFAGARRTLERYGGIDAFVAAFERGERRGEAEFETMTVLAYAAAYSPKVGVVDSPQDLPRAGEGSPESRALAECFDLPFDARSGELDQGVFARWLAFDPVVEVATEAGAEALRGMRAVYLDCGRSDKYALDVGTRLIADRLAARGVAVKYEEFDGGHRGTGGRYDRSLPLLVNALM